VSAGAAAEFFLKTRGYEGFNDPISLSVAQWSTQRFPDPQDGSTLPLPMSMPETVSPGETATIHLETAGADPGIYYITVQATSGAISTSFDLALVVN
jgi:hypothetical protein